MHKLFLILILIIQFFEISADAISAKSAVLIDGMSGRILYEQNAYEKLPMASTTKIMTGLIACESGRFNENVKTSAFASGTEGSSLWLKIGEEQSLENLIYGLMLKSGNDAAVSIAEFLGGNTDAFALIMNKKAREIGALNTNFCNPHGLDAENHYTTSYDLALIAKEAMKNEKFREIVSTKTYSIPMQGEKWDRALKNHNKLLWQYEGCTGIKTGFTKKCGRCLVSSAEKDSKRLICVTLNAPDDWNDHKYLLDYGFSNYVGKTIVKKGEKVVDFTYDNKYKRKVGIVSAENCILMVGKSDVVTTKTVVNKFKAPVKAGTVVGKMTVFCNGEKISETTLITDENIKKLNLWQKVLYKLKK